MILKGFFFSRVNWGRDKWTGKWQVSSLQISNGCKPDGYCPRVSLTWISNFFNLLCPSDCSLKIQKKNDYARFCLLQPYCPTRCSWSSHSSTENLTERKNLRLSNLLNQKCWEWSGMLCVLTGTLNILTNTEVWEKLVYGWNGVLFYFLFFVTKTSWAS